VYIGPFWLNFWEKNSQFFLIKKLKGKKKKKTLIMTQAVETSEFCPVVKNLLNRHHVFSFQFLRAPDFIAKFLGRST
jgi:hypothetical protein